MGRDQLTAVERDCADCLNLQGNKRTGLLLEKVP